MPPETPSIQFIDVPSPATSIATANMVAHGKTFQPQQQILLYSDSEWEEFIKEWVHSQKSEYHKVVRLAGAGDMGIDVAGLISPDALNGKWDCYQCKHYDEALTPTIAYPEIAKILWYSFNKYYAVPRQYFFIAPKSCGPKLRKLLLNANDLKTSLKNEWDDCCAKKITTKGTIKIEGDFSDYVENFDFSIFSFKTPLTIIEEHRKTPYYATRFGGGLPNRPKPPLPPTAIHETESRYIQQLYDVYGEECGKNISTTEDLTTWPHFSSHFDRQREYFYSAEALRNFARDAVPIGTFEDLQSEVFAGVIDIEQSLHPSSMTRLNAVTQAAAELPITSNGLISVTKIQDRRGICHQLANDNRLRWKK